MLACARLPESRPQPVPGRLGIGQGLEGGEGLGHGNDEGGLGVEAGQGLDDLRSVHIGDEAQVDAGRQGFQGLPDQPGTEVRAADADMHKGGEGLARGPADGSVADAVGQGPHAVTPGFHLGAHRNPVGPDVGAVGGPEGSVQHRPALGPVDDRATEQAVPGGVHAAGADQVQHRLEAILRPALLGQVQGQARCLHGQPGQPVGLGGKQVEDGGQACRRRCLVQTVPGGGDAVVGGGRHQALMPVSVSHSRILALGMAPTFMDDIWPSLNSIMVGMPRTP